MRKASLNPTADQTFEVVGEGPYDFARVLDRARKMQEAGDVEGACNERFRAFQRLAELIPDDEEVNLEWTHRNSRAALELVRSGGLVSGEELAPVYCRLSQAERERLEREAKSK